MSSIARRAVQPGEANRPTLWRYFSIYILAKSVHGVEIAFRLRGSFSIKYMFQNRKSRFVRREESTGKKVQKRRLVQG